MEYLEAGRLVYRQSRRYLADVLPLFREALLSTLSLCHLYARLFLHLLRPLLSLLLSLSSLLSPLLSSLLSRLWRFFVAQPARALAAEAAVAFALLALLALERHFGALAAAARLAARASAAVSSRYRSAIAAVRRQSRLAAAALPHLLFAAAVLVFHRAAGALVMAQATGATGLLLAIARPAWTTVKLLYAIDIENKRPLRDDEEEEEEEELLDEPEVAVETLETTPGSGNVRRRRPSTPHSEPYQTRSRTRLQRQITFEVENEASGANLRPPRSPSNVRLSPASEEKKSRRSDATNQPLTPPRRRRSSKRDADDPVNYQASEPAALKFWVTFGLVWTARSIVWYFVPSMLKGAIESLDITLLYVLIWAQLGITKGAEIVYGLVAGVARRRWRRGGRDRTQTANMFLRMAVAANLLRPERLIDMTGMIAESGLALTGVFFLITPRVATFLGTLLVGMLVPVYLTTSMLEGPVNGEARHNWLAYWTVIAAVEGMLAACVDVVGWLPLWYHGKMVVILWLQLPYYRGSVVVLDALMRHVGTALSSVRREAVTPRKRKRA